MVVESIKPKQRAFVGDGIVIFEDVAQAMKAEKVVRNGGYDVKLVAPPPDMRMGCDLALEVNLVERHGLERLFKEKEIHYHEIIPLVKGTSRICEIVKITDYGKWTMVKAGNMKLTYEKGSGIIVNISGGGCPDIPYLNAEMVEKTLAESPLPRELGYTLCATMLQRAYDEAIILHAGGN